MAMAAEVSPFPKEEMTPPLMKINLGCMMFFPCKVGYNNQAIVNGYFIKYQPPFESSFS
jgi:hypothetical protein